MKTDSAVDAFGRKVVAYRDWISNGTSEGSKAAQEALAHVLGLYAAALMLPYPNEEKVGIKVPKKEVKSRWSKPLLQEKLSRLPFKYYGEVFNPMIVPAEQPVLGNIIDDLMDIYGDVSRGLILFEMGREDAAVWEWRFNLRMHWGEHATSAIRALHCWLAKNSDYLLYWGLEEPATQRKVRKRKSRG